MLKLVPTISSGDKFVFGHINPHIFKIGHGNPLSWQAKKYRMSAQKKCKKEVPGSTPKTTYMGFRKITKMAFRNVYVKC